MDPWQARPRARSEARIACVARERPSVILNDRWYYMKILNHEFGNESEALALAEKIIDACAGNAGERWHVATT